MVEAGNGPGVHDTEPYGGFGGRFVAVQREIALGEELRGMPRVKTRAEGLGDVADGGDAGLPPAGRAIEPLPAVLRCNTSSSIARGN